MEPDESKSKLIQKRLFGEGSIVTGILLIIFGIFFTAAAMFGDIDIASVIYGRVMLWLFGVLFIFAGVIIFVVNLIKVVTILIGRQSYPLVNPDETENGMGLGTVLIGITISLLVIVAGILYIVAGIFADVEPGIETLSIWVFAFSIIIVGVIGIVPNLINAVKILVGIQVSETMEMEPERKYEGDIFISLLSIVARIISFIFNISTGFCAGIFIAIVLDTLGIGGADGVLYHIDDGIFVGIIFAIGMLLMIGLAFGSYGAAAVGFFIPMGLALNDTEMPREYLPIIIIVGAIGIVYSSIRK